MSGRGRQLSPEAGQAFTETMLVSWFLLVFIAGMWQLFIANETLYRSIAAAHFMAFERARPRNLSTIDYDPKQVIIIWGKPWMPEAEFPVIHMFQKAVGRPTIAVVSNVSGDRRKRTRMGAGTAGPDGAGGILLYEFKHPFDMTAEIFSNLNEYGSAYYRRWGF